MCFASPKTGVLRHISQTCKRMDCPDCGPRRLEKVIQIALGGEANRWGVLTTRPDPDVSIAAAVRAQRKKIARLRRWWRKEYGPAEFFFSWELHKSGWLHWHFLARSAYVEQRRLSAQWQKLTGSHVVWIEEVAHSQEAAREVCKYLLKTYIALPVECRRLKIYTRTRKWTLPQHRPRTMAEQGWEYLCRTGPGARSVEANFARLNASLLPCDGDHWMDELHCHGPPDPDVLHLMRDLGDRTARTCAALYRLARNPEYVRATPIEQLRDEMDFDTDPRDPWKC